MFLNVLDQMQKEEKETADYVLLYELVKCKNTKGMFSLGGA